MKLKLYSSQEEALRAVTEQLISHMKLHRDPFHLALSGAGTARSMFRLWVEEFRSRINWEQLRFYWVDERCVGPLDEESNYKHAYELLFLPLDIPSDHIHRIFGEKESEMEAKYYSEMVKWELPGYSCLPRFDCVILGIGEDGHIASIFPENQSLLTDERCYAVSQHPRTGQKRITMTGPLILNSKMILIPVLGKEKTAILQKVINASGKGTPVLPASYIIAHAPEATLFTDSQVSVE